MRFFENALLFAVIFAGVSAGGVEKASAVSGVIHAWGSDPGGQVGNAPEGNTFVAIGAGPNHGLALDTNGQIHAWGADDLGQVSNAPVGTGFIAISCRGMH